MREFDHKLKIDFVPFKTNTNYVYLLVDLAYYN